MAGRRKTALSAEERRERKNAAQRAYHARHKEKINAALRQKWATDPDFRARSGTTRREKKYWLQTLYGISLEDYEAMLAAQGGRCALCRRKSELTLCVDHCHPRRMLRALLCRPCNRGLGFFDDDPILLLRAAGYLLAFDAKVEQSALRRKVLDTVVTTLRKLVAQLSPKRRSTRDAVRAKRDPFFPDFDSLSTGYGRALPATARSGSGKSRTRSSEPTSATALPSPDERLPRRLCPARTKTRPSAGERQWDH